MIGSDQKLLEFNEKSIQILFSTSESIQLKNKIISVESGQTFNLPRKEAHQLVKDGKGTIIYEDLFVELKQTISKEKLIGAFELTTIDGFFYLRLNEYSKTLSTREKDSFMALFYELFRLRNGKIIRLASTSSPLLPTLLSKLSFEEVIFLENINHASETLKSSIFPKDD